MSFEGKKLQSKSILTSDLSPSILQDYSPFLIPPQWKNELLMNILTYWNTFISFLFVQKNDCQASVTI